MFSEHYGFFVLAQEARSCSWKFGFDARLLLWSYSRASAGAILWQQCVGMYEASCLGGLDLDLLGLGLLCFIQGNREDTILVGGLHPVGIDNGRQPD